MTDHDHLSLVGVLSATNPSTAELTWYRKGATVQTAVDPTTFAKRRLRVTSVAISSATGAAADVYFGATGGTPAPAADRSIMALQGGSDATVTQRFDRDHGPLGPVGESVYVDGTGLGATDVVVFAELDS